ncbi:signal recognition particle-docking protein FtsY [Alicyclobacillus acidocaldarius]|uniref:Signal recognition particle receptor FtsY n=1 Tax=Alicyclobacillus acidocaldarius subsp. acidocaldarius (strain ATCC 27009 / DSM 446 / BCRC 14685 / JCM 5260 / KCTC 1825 / NBRC 15652 / NCIMB 11725 / NRRL B-14509 / 104-IA) TaxID=521098 RepID=C8WWA5_ALIAD|nr:signal recognition particle-docking protein FtsY [Alicyclobacillus acidocaldarius]ACV58376.1 signal recognition particle-docking protein FtsY [Alicyclobacillus acidocaldarius subsp. acidocaldarius DSM 446]
MGLFDRFRKGLEKSRAAMADRLLSVFRGRRLDDSVFEEMEETLILSDVGVDTAVELVEAIRREARRRRIERAEDLPDVMVDVMVEFLGPPAEMAENPDGPTVVLVVGVNGAGKTTTIGKLAHAYKSQGKRVILAAADTFRAAAIEQLMVWGERVGVDVVRHAQGSDPAAVVYDAIQAAKARRCDLVICDTAGRLQNKAHLMNELAKIRKVAERELPGAPHEVLLVIDGTTGQNGLVQARVFKEVVRVTGIVVTKLDGTAKGGIVFPIVREEGIPVKWIGLGEGMDDLQPFDPRMFAEAICRPETRV